MRADIQIIKKRLQKIKKELTIIDFLICVMWFCFPIMLGFNNLTARHNTLTARFLVFFFVNYSSPLMCKNTGKRGIPFFELIAKGYLPTGGGFFL